MEKVGFYGIPPKSNQKQRLSRSDSSGLGLGSVAAHTSLLRKRKEKGEEVGVWGQLAEGRPRGLG